MTDQVVPNVGSDPINPAYYAGTACAEIIEHMPTNVGFAAKYAWRLGEKDSEKQEAGKAIWYLRRELARIFHHRPLDGGWFEVMSSELIRQTCARGKLDLRRSEIVGECVAYTVDAEARHLERAIQLFEYYLD
jgi:hypothetical protein